MYRCKTTVGSVPDFWPLRVVLAPCLTPHFHLRLADAFHLFPTRIRLSTHFRNHSDSVPTTPGHIRVTRIVRLVSGFTQSYPEIRRPVHRFTFVNPNVTWSPPDESEPQPDSIQCLYVPENRPEIRLDKIRYRLVLDHHILVHTPLR